MPAYTVIERPERDLLGEGPLWSARDNALYWVDIKAPRVNRLSLADGRTQTWTMPETIGWLIERQDQPGFIAGFKRGFARMTLDPLTIDLFGDPESHLPDTRMNDAKADAEGRIWAGSMDERDGAQPIGALRRLDTDFTWLEVDTGYRIANGPTFSPDQKTLYHADSADRIVYAYTVDDDGGLADKHEFVRFNNDMGFPDGMTTDAEGGIWIAAWDGGRVNRFTPDGQLDRVIALPASQITSCAFAGPNLDRLFVTSAAMGRDDEPLAGALFEIDAGVRGLPPGQFGA
jgi:sugar lactone lactonase YvrE